MKGMQRALESDITRFVEAIKIIDQMYTNWGKKNFFDSLGLRIKYGVTEEQAQLARIPYVGKSAINKLWDANIRTPRDVVKYRKRVMGVLGGKKSTDYAQKVIRNAKELLGI